MFWFGTADYRSISPTGYHLLTLCSSDPAEVLMSEGFRLNAVMETEESIRVHQCLLFSRFCNPSLSAEMDNEYYDQIIVFDGRLITSNWSV